jgi:hypothetical protein
MRAEYLFKAVMDLGTFEQKENGKPADSPTTTGYFKV